jgi:phosphatidylinositol alpha-1,6-mannosyltransferase
LKILYLVPDFFGMPGGIARNCRVVAKALTESAALERLDILALHDEPGTPIDRRYLTGNCFTYAGFNGSRVAFSRAAYSAMGHVPYDLLLSAHVNLSPLLFLRRTKAHRATVMHGKEVWRRLSPRRRLPLQWSDSVISVSQFTADRAIRSNGVRPSRVHLLHNCLDPTLARPDVAANGNAAGNAVLTVSRLSRAEFNKGQDVVLKALVDIVPHVPDVQYHIVGEGDLRPNLEALAERLGLTDRVIFHGSVSDEELAAQYAACSVFAMPSTEEGFGFVFLEAMLYGRSIVASTTDAGAEVVGNNEAGLLVDPRDTADVARALRKLLTDKDLQRRLGETGRQRVERLFGYAAFKAKLWQYIADTAS